MVFSSAVFIWFFLPFVFIVNCFLKTRISNLFLLLASLFFYAWGEPVLVFVMLLSIVVNWLCARGITRFPDKKKLMLILGICFDLAVLGYYKYAGFLVSILNSVCKRELFPVPEVTLPIGISFFTFQAISFIIDIYRHDTEGKPKLINTALYISFFPQLIAGPIVKYKDINKQIENRQISKSRVAVGFKRFIYGLGKKVLIANVLSICADRLFSMEASSLSGGMCWVAALLYTFQIYYDFSGYSDMAIGLGKIFGFKILENFDHPYMSSSIQEFWNRWHISLGSWFKEYLYIPLGGNRKGKGRTYINLFIVFFLTGLWHGANVSYIVWGLYHGVLSVIERLGLKKLWDRHRIIGTVYSFLMVNFGWVIFRMENIRSSLIVIGRMLMPFRYTMYSIPAEACPDRKTVIIFIFAVIGAGFLQKLVPGKLKAKWKGSVPEAVFCVGILILCLASIASNTYNPFIYFQF